MLCRPSAESHLSERWLRLHRVKRCILDPRSARASHRHVLSDKHRLCQPGGSLPAYEVCGSPRPSGGARLWDSAVHHSRHRRFVAIATGSAPHRGSPGAILSLLLWLGLQPRPGTREASPSASLPPPVPPSSKLGGTGGAPPTDRNLLRNQRCRPDPRARRSPGNAPTTRPPSRPIPIPIPPAPHPPDRSTACGSRSEIDQVGAA